MEFETGEVVRDVKQDSEVIIIEETDENADEFIVDYDAMTMEPITVFDYEQNDNEEDGEYEISKNDSVIEVIYRDSLQYKDTVDVETIQTADDVRELCKKKGLKLYAMSESRLEVMES